MEKLDSIILAGGLGTRLREVVPELPKVLAPVNNKPFLDIILSSLSEWECIEKVVIAVGYMADKIIERYKDTSRYNFKILFSVEEKLLGTGGAIKKVLPQTETDNVLVLNGDSYIEADLYGLVKKHMEVGSSMTIVLREVENASRYGRVKLNSDNRIIYFEEKTPERSKGYINAGMYLIKRKLFDEVKEDKVISLERELLPVFIGKGVYGYISCGRFIDIGVPEAYKIADKYLKEIC
ncbi:MAG: nucleotidyltransferase family protein [Thermodesulfobacteriota bacterium]